MDKSQEISSRLWTWFTHFRDRRNKGRSEWDECIRTCEEIINQYKKDDLNYQFAKEMAIVFINQLERLEKI